MDTKKRLTVSESNGKPPKCSSRNAVMARMNRQKKKRFVESLKKDVARLSTENNKLRQTLEAQLTTFESSLDLPQDDIFPDVGVCLHVCKKRVSLEFCSVCSSNAQSDWDNLDFIK